MNRRYEVGREGRTAAGGCATRGGRPKTKQEGAQARAAVPSSSVVWAGSGSDYRRQQQKNRALFEATILYSPY
jgi:hypothetical protein